MLQSQTSATDEPDLFLRSYEASDAVAHVQAQARRLRPAVWSCIERARAEGTSLVVEGTHLVPELYNDIGARFVVLATPEFDEHQRRLLGHRHTRRTVSVDDVARAREIGLFYEREARRWGVQTLRYADNFDEVVGALGLTIRAGNGALPSQAPFSAR